MPSQPPDKRAVQIKRELQLLKDDSGTYVLSNLASMNSLPKLVEYIDGLVAAEVQAARLSERAWAYKNMRDHGTDPQWVEVARLRLERLQPQRTEGDDA